MCRGRCGARARHRQHEWVAFTADGGYVRPELWLSDGWNAVQQHGSQAPSYWSEVDGGWQVFTTAGVRAARRAQPVCHVSF
jgi:formylglycine-generating enzyme required for sulfatase activity